MLCETRTRPSNDAPSYLYVCLKIEPPHTESAGSRPFLWCLIFVCRENPRNVRQIIKSTQSAMITLRCSRGFSHTRPPEKSEQYSRHSYYMGEEGKKRWDQVERFHGRSRGDLAQTKVNGVDAAWKSCEIFVCFQSDTARITLLLLRGKFVLKNVRPLFFGGPRHFWIENIVCAGINNSNE